jgi:hypothetical protein
VRNSRLFALTFAVLMIAAARSEGSEDLTDTASQKTASPEAKKAIDASFIPEDCFLALVVHPKRLAESPLAAKIPKETADWMFHWAAGKRGFDLRGVEDFISIVAPCEPVDESERKQPDSQPRIIGARLWKGATIIRFAEPIAKKELMAKMFKDYDLDPQQATYERRTYCRGRLRYFSPSGRDLAVYFPDKRTIVFAENEPLLKKMLSASEGKGNLAERLRQLSADNDLVMILTTQGAGESLKGPAKQLAPEMPPGIRDILEASELGKVATITVDLRSDPVATLLVEASSEEDAAKLQSRIEKSLATMKSMVTGDRDAIITNGPPAFGKWIVEFVEQVFDGITLARDGAKVTGALKRPKALDSLPDFITAGVAIARASQDRLNRRGQSEGEVGMVVIYEVDSGKSPGASKLPAPEMHKLLAALDERLNPVGRRSGVIRLLDDGRIEVSIFRADRGVMQRIADLLPRPGTLEFRILANKHDHAKLIERAKVEPKSNALHDDAGNRLAWWVPVERGQEKTVNAYNDIATRTTTKDGHDTLEVLIVDDEFDVNGRYLQSVGLAMDDRARPCVSLNFNRVGSALFGRLTGKDVPDRDAGVTRKLGIILDGTLHSAPTIMASIWTHAIIEGDFTDEQARDLADVLHAGELPTAIRKVKQQFIDAERPPTP